MGDSELGWWIRAFAYASFAALGGVLGHLMRLIDKKQKVHWGRAALEGVAAGFVGILMLLLCDAMNLSQQWTGVIVGVSGWMGASVSMRILEIVVRRRLDVSSTPSATPTQGDKQ